ncbi:winged helix DNA-binding protein [Methanoculleus sp.]|uniref:winged helix DNA-binding protein n=1 Tax=Methanoculleus sp. TaxID=90427 RepID=UPI0025E83621|nr:winged helix DNA-binding protein [Methanoculleus sp.]MCK9319149.1 hypothetical protein [Methanoculleus sp.]
MNEKLISYVLAGKNRRNVLNLISQGAMTPSQILKKAKYTYLTHIIRTLKDLNKMELIECVNPEAKSYKFYKITKKGKSINEAVQKYLKEYN